MPDTLTPPTLTELDECLEYIDRLFAGSRYAATPDPYATFTPKFLSQLPLGDQLELTSLQLLLGRLGRHRAAAHAVCRKLVCRVEPLRLRLPIPPPMLVHEPGDRPRRVTKRRDNIKDGIRRLYDNCAPYESVEFHYDHLRLTTPPITLTCEDTEASVAFSGFFVDIHLSALAEDQTKPGHLISVDTDDPHYAAGGENFIHPHVEGGGSVCFGEAAEQLLPLVSGGYVDAIADLMYGHLTTYNSNSPFVSLENWEGATCDNCGCTFDNDCDGGSCEECGNMCCGDHLYTCDGCSTMLCSAHCQRAADRNRYCDDCGACCDCCGEFYSSDDLYAGLCDGCGSDCRGCGERGDADNFVKGYCPDCCDACNLCGEAEPSHDLEDGLCEDCRIETEEAKKAEDAAGDDDFAAVT